MVPQGASVPAPSCDAQPRPAAPWRPEGPPCRRPAAAACPEEPAGGAAVRCAHARNPESGMALSPATGHISASPSHTGEIVTVPAGLRDALRDRYVLERELGRGGMATVYLAHDLRHDRPVALKVLHPELAATLGPERFQREIQLAARLQHPHILTVHDSGEAAGQLWFTMPFVEGESLRDRLRRERQLPVDDALRIASEAARALDYAHQHGVVHRDIKPENILLTGDGSTLVADFGIARALRRRTTGSPRPGSRSARRPT